MKNNNVKISEKVLEKKHTIEVKKLGGLSIKLYSQLFTGLPDRLVLMPVGRAYFAEFKTTGKSLSFMQQTVRKILEKLGFIVFVVDSFETLDYSLLKMKG